jgi:hypothetical protein
MITSVTGLTDPGHPGPPGTIALVPFPSEQMPGHAARPLDEWAVPTASGWVSPAGSRTAQGDPVPAAIPSVSTAGSVAGGQYGLWSMVASKTTLCESAQFSDDSGAVCSFPRTWLIASMASHSEESVNGGPSSSVSYIDGITDGDIGGHGAVWGSIEADSYALATCG